jgi:rRNA processing protein Gar1
MEIGKPYYYITDGVIKRGIYFQYDDIVGPDKPYIIKKEAKDIKPSDKHEFEFVDKVYYIPQARGGKKRRTRRGKKSSRKSRKSRK